MVDVLEEINNNPTMGLIVSNLNVITFSIIAAYLAFIYVIGPRLMKNRPAFKLKLFMSIYNIAQVVLCFYINHLTWKLTSWDLFKVTECISYESNKTFDDLAFKIYLLKVFELTDTIIFVLRKKQNQISYLHVFHHTTVITLVHILMTIYKDKVCLVSTYLNGWIHVIMYSYYFFANVCSAETMKKYVFIKKSITIMQMIQFVIILSQNAVTWALCDIDIFCKSYYCFIILALLYGFYDFFQKAYTNRKDKKLESKAK